MKKVVSFLIALSLCTGFLSLYAADALTKDEANIVYSLAQRKSYRLGLRASIISPTDNIQVSKDAAYDLGLEFDAKLNENLDTGPRFGLIGKKLNNGTSVNANYTAIKFGYGGRIYTMYWGEYGSSHGFFNLYITGQVDYYVVNKTSDITSGGALTNPSAFAGIGGYGGVGVELAFGPNTGGFIEAGMQRISVKATAGEEFPLDGYVIATGARLAFF
ncbi:MAG: hypothetical protein WC632_05450 [Candidatus Margulisiibacteriota bacterium]